MTCAKQRVRVTLTHPDGRQWIGENRCRNPQATCPRAPGEDYTKCRTVCDQVGHAELDALQQAGEHARGCIASLEGHSYYCMPCQHSLFAAGVVALNAPPQGACVYPRCDCRVNLHTEGGCKRNASRAPGAPVRQEGQR